MADIDIGTPAIDRPQYVSQGNTLIVVANPANASGTITDIDVYIHGDVTGLKFGIFELISGTTFKCRSAVSIGDAAAGLREYTGLTLTVVAGDYIGAYWSFGNIDRHDAGGDGYWYEGSDNCVVDDETEYTLSSGRILSLYGEGALAAKAGNQGHIFG